MNKRLLLPLVSLLAFSLGGCLGPQDSTRYYALSSGSIPPPMLGESPTLHVGLRPVDVVSYLNRSAMAVRVDGHELTYISTRRWGESLDAAFNRVFADDLLRHLPEARILPQPWPTSPLQDWRVEVQVRRMEGERLPDGTTRGVLEAVWSIDDPSGQSESLSGSELFYSSWDGEDYSALVAGLNSSVDALAARLAEAMRAASPAVESNPAP